MTTIAYHHGDRQIATDSRITCSGNISSDKFNKSIKNKDGIWFFSGDVSDYGDLLGLKHNDEISPIPSCCAYLIKNKKVYLVSVNSHGYCQYTFLDYNDTLGSGGDFALAAMDHGKSAKEAVKYAMTRDVYTGGRVRVYSV